MHLPALPFPRLVPRILVILLLLSTLTLEPTLPAATLDATLSWIGAAFVTPWVSWMASVIIGVQIGALVAIAKQNGQAGSWTTSIVCGAVMAACFATSLILLETVSFFLLLLVVMSGMIVHEAVVLLGDATATPESRAKSMRSNAGLLLAVVVFCLGSSTIYTMATEQKIAEQIAVVDLPDPESLPKGLVPNDAPHAFRADQFGRGTLILTPTSTPPAP